MVSYTNFVPSTKRDFTSSSAAFFKPVSWFLWAELKNVALPGRASAGFGVPLLGLRKFGLFAIYRLRVRAAYWFQSVRYFSATSAGHTSVFRADESAPPDDGRRNRLGRKNDFLNDASRYECFSDAAWDMELFSYVRISFGLQKHGGFLFLAEVPPTSCRAESVTGFWQRSSNSRAVSRRCSMRPAIEMTGKKFGRLTVLGRATNGSYHAKWDCVCTCGGFAQPAGTDLRLGRVNSCGCLSREKSSARMLARAISR